MNARLRLRRRVVALALGWALALTVAVPLGQATTLSDDGGAQRTFRIGFHLWKPGKIYDEAMAGIRDGLEIEGILYEAVIMHSDRDKALAAENLLKLDSMGLDLIYSLSSAGTKIAKGLNLRTPIVATVINHPASLGVGQDSQGAVTKLTGTSYYVDAMKQLALYGELFPNIETVGMIYDENNPAGALAEEPFMRAACQEMGLRFESIAVSDKSAIEGAAKRLVGEGVDLIVIPTNRLVYGNLEIILEVTGDRKIPVVAMNKQGVEFGALAGLFADTYDLGRKAATMARRIMERGVDPGEIDFEYIAQPDIILNMTSAANINYEFPAEVLGGAAIVLQ